MKSRKIYYIISVICVLAITFTGVYIILQPQEKYFDFRIEIRTEGSFTVLIPVLYDLGTNESIDYVYNKMVMSDAASSNFTITDHGLALNITDSGNETIHIHEKDPPNLYYPLSMQEWGTRHIHAKTGTIHYWIFCNSSGNNLKFSQKLFASQIGFDYESTVEGELINGWQVIQGHGTANSLQP